MSLRPVALAFALFGLFIGSWAVATADIEHGLGFTHAEFGLLLVVALGGAAVTNYAGGPLTERWGTARALSRSLLAWGAVLAAASALHSTLGFGAALVAAFAAGGGVDVVLNIVTAAAYAQQPGHLVRFHGLFNAGAAGGALITGLLLRAGVTWRWLWLAVGLAAVVLGLLSTRATLPAGATGANSSPADSLRALRDERLIMVSIAFAASAMIEGGIGTWGVLYLRERLASGVLLGAAAATIGYSVAAGTRFVLGPRAGAAGAERGVAIGAGLAAGGLVALTATNVAAVAAVGLAAASMGISMCWPLLVALASDGRDRPGLVVGGITTAGYLGLVLGPAMIGGLASTIGVRGGLAVLAGLAVFVAVAPNRRSRVGAPAGRPIAD